MSETKEVIIEYLMNYLKVMQEVKITSEDNNNPRKKLRQLSHLRKKAIKDIFGLKKRFPHIQTSDLSFLDSNLRDFVMKLGVFIHKNKGKWFAEEEIAEFNEDTDSFISHLQAHFEAMHDPYYPLKEEDVSLARNYFREDFIRENADLLASIRLFAGRSAGIAYLHLEDIEYLIPKHSKELTCIAGAAREDTYKAYESLSELPEDLVVRHIIVIAKIAEKSGKRASISLEFLPVDLIARYSQALLLIAEKSKDRTGWIFRYLPKSIFINKTPKEAYKEIDRLLRKYGFALFAVFDRYKRETDFEKNYDLLIGKNKGYFGITNIHRYLVYGEDGKLDQSILSENLRNINKDYNADRPLALAIFNHWDHSDTFSTKAASLLTEISSRYKLFLFEVSTREGLFKAVNWCSSYGLISLLIIAGHGKPRSIELGHSSVRNSSLSYLDKEIFRGMSSLIANGGTIILDACSTGEGGRNAHNLATEMKKYIPHAIIYAPETACTRVSSKFGSGGLIREIEFDVRTLKLAA